MDKKQKSRRLKALRREKRFARRAVITSVTICALLCGGIAYAIRAVPVYVRAEIDNAIDTRIYSRAQAMSKYLFNSDAEETVAKRISYAKATDLLNAGELEAARRAFSGLGNFMDSASLVKECQLRQADDMFDSGDFESAQTAYRLLGGYSYAPRGAQKCAYQIALKSLAAGDTREAIERFDALGDFEDAREQRNAAALRFTGLDDIDEALDALNTLTDEQIAQERLWSGARESIRRGVIDVGYKHIVGLMPDGTALAAGDNTYGQLEVSDWTDVIYVCAGAYHSVGLRADGTVLAAGDGQYGQTDVSGWTNVKAVAVNDWDTFALLDDGTIKHTGFHTYDELDGLSGVASITAGSYAFGWLYDTGGMLSTSALCYLPADAAYIQAELGTGYAVGLKSDGSVDATFGDIDWYGVMTISACGAGVVGIDVNNRLLAHFFWEKGAPDIGALEDVVGVACSGGIVAALVDDGSVHIWGDDNIDVSDWDLIN